MKIILESDREVTIDGVGLVTPGEPAVVQEAEFVGKHGYTPAQANFPPFVTVTYDSTEGGE